MARSDSRFSDRPHGIDLGTGAQLRSVLVLTPACGHHDDMIKRSVSPAASGGKGWFTGPWDSSVPVAVGWADRGVDLLHRHKQMYEVYLVARGYSTALVEGVKVELAAGDMLAVEPGESHTFVASSPDYLHFVVQAPFVPGDKLDLA